ncbi:DegV family protein [Bacillaceae bacterium Marseille-Q3522]|nr:DegV family protein [Bacillaceae bacterium Marseille-Q3522]
MTIQLITDGSADLPQSLAEDLQIQIVPLYVHFGAQQYKTNTIDAASFLHKLTESEDFPQSSAPGPHEFYEVYKQIPKEVPIIMLSLSEGISSAYHHAVMGMNMLLEEQPDRKIAVINSRTASAGLILLLQDAANKIAEGNDFEQVVAHLQDRVEHTVTLFILKTLENLVRGGRLDKVRGAIARTLNIKLLMRASEEGTIEVTEKVRGDKKSIRRFIEQISGYISNAEDKVLTMTHCHAHERAKRVLDEIKKMYSFKKTILSEMGPAIASHSGEGGIVISFFRDK